MDRDAVTRSSCRSRCVFETRVAILRGGVRNVEQLNLDWRSVNQTVRLAQIDRGDELDHPELGGIVRRGGRRPKPRALVREVDVNLESQRDASPTPAWTRPVRRVSEREWPAGFLANGDTRPSPAGTR